MTSLLVHRRVSHIHPSRQAAGDRRHAMGYARAGDSVEERTVGDVRGALALGRGPNRVLTGLSKNFAACGRNKSGLYKEFCRMSP